MTQCKRITIDRDIFPESIDHANYSAHRETAQWIWAPKPHLDEPSVVFFRCVFTVADAQSLIFHVSADNRFELFLDGQRIGRGPSRGDRFHWCFETYEASLEVGDHVLAARAWYLPDQGSPMAQFLVRPGFVVLAEGPLHESLTTGHGPWRCLPTSAYTDNGAVPGECYFTGWSFILDGNQYPWNWKEGQGDWLEPVVTERATGLERSPYSGEEAASRWGLHHLIADTLPPMMEVERRVGCVRFASTTVDVNMPVVEAQHDPTLAAGLQAMLDGQAPFVVPAHTAYRAIIDLDEYYCAFPELHVSGGQGGVLDLAWAESLFEDAAPHSWVKGDRSAIWNKWFRGHNPDRFVLEGGNRMYDTLWWRDGRYLQLVVCASDEPLTIDALLLRETRYPLERESTFAADDARLALIEPIMLRALQMCSHETFMDCPYYEQLMYVGDTRLEVLTTYVTTFDTRLPKRAIQLFDWSRAVDGLTKSRYPSQVLQVIPPFSLWWVAMVHDYFMWRDADVSTSLPAINTILGAFEGYLNDAGLVDDPKGWNFCDWVPAWAGGVPPNGHGGVSCLLNLQFLYSLDRGAEMLAYNGKTHQAAHWSAVADALRPAILSAFWDEERGMLADDLGKTLYSEHCQVLAILCDLVEGKQKERLIEGLLHAPDLARCTIYFSHYLFEACAKIDSMDALWDRLGTWFELHELGFKTTREMPEPSRSDCHAWGAYPLYHYYATMAGIRPAAPGFSAVNVEPHFGPLAHIQGTLPHPSGEFITFDLNANADASDQRISLPRGVTGSLLWQGKHIDL